VELSESIPIEEFVVWIDPIDNTRGFIKGTLDAVTILIGLSRKERAYLGVLGLPYQKVDQKIVFEPEILVGTVEGKKAFTTSAPQ
jgi:3'-phosphoadenosine 5'-phosphosulfate (PAPS) 3'-phosphatase